MTRAAVEGLVQEIELHRAAYAATLPEPGRSRVQASRLTLGKENGDKHARTLAAFVDELGLERVIAVMDHRWAQCAAGTLTSRMAACSFHGDGGGFAGSLAEVAAGEERARVRAERRAPQDIDDRPCMSAAELMAASAGIDALGARAKPVEADA